MLACCCNQHLANFFHVAAVSHPHWHAKSHPTVAIAPIRHRRIDEFLVRHDHGDVVVSHNQGAPGADLLHLTGDACDFDAITDGDGAFRQNKQPADEIAGDVFQTKPQAYTDRAGEYRQCPEMDTGIVKNNDNPDDQHGIADYLGNGVLQGAVEAASDQDAIKKEMPCAG